MDIADGDRVVITGGVGRRTWVVSTVNNRVVKYFDENGSYGQMPLTHLEAMVKDGRAAIVRQPADK